MMFLLLVSLFIENAISDIRLKAYTKSDGGVKVDGVEPTPRFRIDPSTAECEEFSYLGSGLDFNNFKSMEECTNHLTVTPLNNLEACKHPLEQQPKKLCTSSKQTLKKFFKYNPQKVDANNGAITPEYYECRIFLSTGCEDTKYYFENNNDCENACLAKRTNIPNEFDCTVPHKLTSSPDGGETHFNVKIVYDKVRNQCVYSAVDSNQKRGIFRTFRHCVLTCVKSTLNVIPECTGLPYQSTCDGPISLKYYYNQTSLSCVPFYSTECGKPKNVNQFDTIELCAGKCPVAVQNWRYVEAFCRIKPDSGKGNLELPRWYYDNETANCYSFSYKGIGGNKNRFIKKELCLAACSQISYPLMKSPSPIPKNNYGINNN